MNVIERINHGGFGVVDKVRLTDGTIVARKTFSPSFPHLSPAEREKLRKRFLREVRYQSSMRSQAICPILDSDLDDANPWFTMPLAEKTLEQEIAQCKAAGTVPAQALADVLNGLEELHGLGFVHRDLKPHNILLIAGSWKLTDFGLVLPPAGATSQLSSIGSAWGTEHYAAPEQRTEFHSVGPPADIYSFGCILHDIFGISPRVPYSKHSAPGPIGGVIERCTDPRAERRFSAVGVLRSAMLPLIVGTPESGVSETAGEWIERLASSTIDDRGKCEALVRFIKQDCEEKDRRAVLSAIDEEAIVRIYEVDQDVWKVLCLEYCDWVMSSIFNFQYCDVLVQRLVRIFELGDTEVKAAVALSTADMAETHNRWYVMERLVRMCGPDLNEAVASRIAIDIRAFRAEAKFRRCADAISHSYGDYHPQIRTVIEA